MTLLDIAERDQDSMCENPKTPDCIFDLDNFEGPLDLLLHLIQNKEIDIYSITIKDVTGQFSDYLKKLPEYNIDMGAEFLSTTATLILFKSKMLLPKEEKSADELEIHPRIQIIDQLLDYLRFKKIAKNLHTKEIAEQAFFPRGVNLEPSDQEVPLKADFCALGDLTKLFYKILEQKHLKKQNPIYDETFTIHEKVIELRNLLRENSCLLFEEVFIEEKSKDELIVIFLAFLELIKLQKIKVEKKIDSDNVTYKLEWIYDND